MRTYLGILAAVIAATPAGAAIPGGVWANPSRSVHVTFKRCGEAMCGTVVWASAKAKEDARRGGTDPLVGTRLFDRFVEEDDGLWSGEVFVPDIGQRVSGTVERIDARTLRGEGCLFAGLGCQSQTWKRIK